MSEMPNDSEFVEMLAQDVMGRLKNARAEAFEEAARILAKEEGECCIVYTFLMDKAKEARDGCE